MYGTSSSFFARGGGGEGEGARFFFPVCQPLLLPSHEKVGGLVLGIGSRLLPEMNVPPIQENVVHGLGGGGVLFQKVESYEKFIL